MGHSSNRPSHPWPQLIESVRSTAHTLANTSAPICLVEMAYPSWRGVGGLHQSQEAHVSTTRIQFDNLLNHKTYLDPITRLQAITHNGNANTSHLPHTPPRHSRPPDHLHSCHALDDTANLTIRSRGGGAHCPNPLLATVALNTDQNTTPQYSICCPDSTPDGMKLVDEVVCCKHVSDFEHSCSDADGTLVIPASVTGCDEGWDKESLKGVKFCVKKK